MSTLDQQLRLAIAEKRLIEVRYHGDPRIAEPHDYGRHKGVDKVLGYQIRNTAAPRDPRQRGWRWFELAQIEACRVLDEHFPGSRGAQHQNHQQWDILYARVS